MDFYSLLCLGTPLILAIIIAFLLYVAFTSPKHLRKCPHCQSYLPKNAEKCDQCGMIIPKVD